jgi:AraC family transcriptional regulator
MTKPATIPPQWQRFHPYIGNVPGSVPGNAYGIVGPMAEDTDAFDYLCGVEVAGNAELPPDFVVWTIPAGKYAKATHHGHVTTIRSTIGALTEEWLPQSGYAGRHDVLSFVEFYGRDFSATTGLGTMEIWVGLKG